MAEQHTVRERFSETIFAMLSETFEQVQGIYLDRGTSLFETLAGINAEQASQPLSSQSGSIAAKVSHVRFYLDVLEMYMLEKPVGKVDWQASWQPQTVSAEEWAGLLEQLRTSYQRVLGTIKTIERWEGEHEIGGAMAIAIHTAYHLGEIRQALPQVQS